MTTTRKITIDMEQLDDESILFNTKFDPPLPKTTPEDVEDLSDFDLTSYMILVAVSKIANGDIL